jgi:hypothetical protein
MQTIFVMVKCELGKAYDVADDACNVEQVSEVYSTSGPVRPSDEVLSRREDRYPSLRHQQNPDALRREGTFTLIGF